MGSLLTESERRRLGEKGRKGGQTHFLPRDSLTLNKHPCNCWYSQYVVTHGILDGQPGPVGSLCWDCAADSDRERFRSASSRYLKKRNYSAAAVETRGCPRTVKRYEAGSSPPTLDVIRNMSVALGVTSDQLLFCENQRGPDEELRLQFAAVSRFSAEEKK